MKLAAEPRNPLDPEAFGRGRRLFGVLPSRVELEIVRAFDTPEATPIHDRVSGESVRHARDRDCGGRALAAVSSSHRVRPTWLVMEHPIRFPPSLSLGRRQVLVCAVLIAFITALRVAVSNPIEAVGFLYVIPIAMLATQRGVRAD